MDKRGYEVDLYPPPKVGGFTATEDKMQRKAVRQRVFLSYRPKAGAILHF